METIHQNNVPDIKQTVIIQSPIQKVWETVTTSEGIASWFMPNDFELQLGHEFSCAISFRTIPL